MLKSNGRSLLKLVCGSLIGFAAACGKETPLPEIHQLAASLTGNHHFDHVILIVLENEDAITVTKVPYMDSLAKRGVYFSNYYAVAHPSYPNYLAIVSGHTFIDDDEKARPDPIAYNRRDFGDAQLLIDAPTVADGLEAQHTSWNAFAEDYPVVEQLPRRCDFRSSSGLYARKHFPFLSFKGFHDHPELCSHIRNLKWFRADSLAGFTFIAPNLIHDGHNAPLSSAVTWLRGFMSPVINNPAVMDSTLVVITFDESASTARQTLLGNSNPNVVYTVFLGNMVKGGTRSSVPYSHYNLERTIETNFGLPSIGPANTSPIDGVWR
jgi:phosphoesterase family protein